MATKTIEHRTCDVCGTCKNVVAHKLVMSKSDSETAIAKDIDLCPKHAERLVSFIERGMSPPTPSDKGNKPVSA